MTVRTVSSHILNLHGAARTGDTVRFRLLNGTYTGTEHVPTDTTQTTIDASGNISVDLYAAALYDCMIAGAMWFTFVLPDGPSPVTLESLHASSAPMLPPANDFQTMIDAEAAARIAGDAALTTALTGKANVATTLADYGIGDAYTKTAADARYAPISHNQAWSTITATPTTLSGYGITDAYTKAQVDSADALKANLSGGNALTGLQAITTGAAGTRGLTILLAASQTAPALEVQDSTTAVLTTIKGSGVITAPAIQVGSTLSPATGQIHIGSASPSVYFDRNNVTEWLVYQPSNATLAVRDVVNARMQVTYTGGAAGSANTVFSDRLITRRGASGQTTDLHSWQDESSVVLTRIDKGGYFMTRKTAAPADGDLIAGEMALWLDATNGAAKLMVKAKEASGTVRTATVALA